MLFSSSFSLDSPLSPEEVADRIRTLLPPPRAFVRRQVAILLQGIRGGFGNPRYYVGCVSPRSFTLTADGAPRFSLTPVVSGAILPTSSGTNVRVTVAPERIWLAIQAPVSLLMAGLAAYVAIETVSMKVWWFTALVLLVIAIVPWFTTADLVRVTARHLHSRLSALLSSSSDSAA